MLSLIIPIYKNELNLERLLDEVGELRKRLTAPMEVVFVVDGSPDRSLEVLKARLPGVSFPARLLSLSRNFGSFSAITAGLEAGAGDYFAVLAADLQEPPELIAEFHEVLSAGRADVVFGCRSERSDPWSSKLSSGLFWSLYRILVLPDMPKGGVDVFGCTRQVRDCVLRCPESNSSLIALLFWVGFRRHFATYERRPRREGKSAWTFRKKLKYSLDSIFNFTDLPIQLLLWVGAIGIAVAIVFAAILIVSKLSGKIPVPGYSAIVLTIVFFGALTSLGLGIVGQYLWLTLQNARRRPNYIVSTTAEYPGRGPATVNRTEEDRKFFGQ
jgi:glycosyltransferase involved in cell wall biosynthesis